jgi:ribosomal protein S18 acetylase RimI-like enzyme
MAVTESISRLINYYERHGFGATLQRSRVFLRRLFLFRRFVVYYFDLSKNANVSLVQNWPEHLTVTRVSRQEEIETKDWEKIVNLWNPELSRRNFSKRFKEGATAWLIRSHGDLAGYGWTLTGRSIQPHFLPFGPNDVHLFDFLVFPEFRGQRMNPRLVSFILNGLIAENRSRAYIEVAEWNQAQLASLSHTDFHRLGVAHKTLFRGRTVVVWGSSSETAGSTKAQGSPKI